MGSHSLEIRLTERSGRRPGRSPAPTPANDLLAAGSASDPRAAAAESLKAAEDALAVVREIRLHLQDWESMHEILEATRSIMDQQDAIRRGLQGPGGAGVDGNRDAPKGR